MANKANDKQEPPVQDVKKDLANTTGNISKPKPLKQTKDLKIMQSTIESAPNVKPLFDK